MTGPSISKLIRLVRSARSPHNRTTFLSIDVGDTSLGFKLGHHSDCERVEVSFVYPGSERKNERFNIDNRELYTAVAEVWEGLKGEERRREQERVYAHITQCVNELKLEDSDDVSTPRSPSELPSPTDDALKDILGSCYGGPSLSYEGGKFVIYTWGDAPVGHEIRASGDTILQAAKAFMEKVGR